MEGASSDQLDEKRRQMVGEVYRMAAYAFGNRPLILI